MEEGADRRPAEPPDDEHGTRSELSGSASDVVQARDIHGGVHFHGQVIPAGSAPRQLPGGVRGFVNRDTELGRLADALVAHGEERHGVAVFVIAGTAGVGKTSLALHWAHQVRESFPDGQLYVNLRGYDPGVPVTPEQVLDRFLRALGVPAASIPGDLEARAALFRSLLADRRVLIVLDNAATAAQVRPLLPGTAECLVLVTSRSRLSGLVARDGALRVTIGMLSEQESVALLRAAMSTYRREDSEAELVELARLCARLPLALRIAAERAVRRPGTPLGKLIAELRDESILWDALAAEDDEEADAVRTVFAWSYRALPEAAARTFRRLGLHPGSEFGTPVVAALIGADITEANHQLDLLVGAHLLETQSLDRYQFHDLLRAYAADQARREETPGSRFESLRRMLSWYLQTANAAVRVVGPTPRITPDPPEDGIRPLVFAGSAAVFRWYDTERDNLAAVVRTAAETGTRSIAWQLPALLKPIYAYRNQVDDWLAATRTALAAVRAEGDRFGEAEVLESLGKAYTQSQRLREGLDHHAAALAIRREIDDRLGVVTSLNGIGLVHLRALRLRESASHFEQAAAAAGDLGERGWEATALSNLAAALSDLGDVGEAVALYGRALAVHRELGARAGEGEALAGLARALRRLQRPAEAESTIRDALTLARDFGADAWEAHWLLELGRIQVDAGDPEQALVSYQRSALLQGRIGDRSREAMALVGTGVAYRALERHGEAIDFHRRAVALLRLPAGDWPLAVALDNLAIDLDLAGDSDEAMVLWREALGHLDGLEGAEPGAARERISALLREPPGRPPQATG